MVIYNVSLPKKITNEKEVVRELEILSELYDIITHRLTCKYVMLGANNHKLAEGSFKNGERVKKWKFYYPDRGKIKAEYNFTDNSITQYNVNRSKNSITSKNEEISYQYDANNKHRLVQKWITTKKEYGKLISSFKYYDNGKLQEQYAAKLLGNDKDGYRTDVNVNLQLYYANGKIKAKGEFVDHDNTGTWCFYDEKGKYLGEKIYQDKDAFWSGASNYFAKKRRILHING